MDAETKTPSIREIIGSYPFRLCLYGMITIAVYQVVFLGVRNYGADMAGSENGPIESAQVLLALVAAACFFAAAYRNPIGRAALILCGAVVTYGAARESDQWFEQLFFDDAYKWLVGLPMFLIVVVALAIHRGRIVGEMMWMLRQPAATLFAVAGIFMCGVCQSLDRPDMWLSVSDAREVEITKGMIEEYSELFAYLLLAFSGLEAVILARQTARRCTGPPRGRRPPWPHRRSRRSMPTRRRGS